MKLNTKNVRADRRLSKRVRDEVRARGPVRGLHLMPIVDVDGFDAPRLVLFAGQILVGRGWLVEQGLA